MPSEPLIENPLPGEYGQVRAAWYFDHLLSQAIESAMKELLERGLTMQQVAQVYSQWVINHMKLEST